MKKTTAYARKQARMPIPQEQIDLLSHPVAVTGMSELMAKRMARLKTDASLHIYTGGDACAICDLFGYAAYIALFATAANGLADGVDARILQGSANALLQLRSHPEALERQRPTLLSGVQALDRLMSQLHPLDMAVADFEFDQIILARRALYVEDLQAVHAASMPEAQPATRNIKQAISKGIALQQRIHQQQAQAARAAIAKATGGAA